MQSAGVGQGLRVPVLDDQRVFERAGREGELDREKEFERIERARLLVGGKLQAQEILALLAHHKILLPGEAVQREGIAVFPDAHASVARRADDGKEHRRRAVPKAPVDLPDEIDAALSARRKAPRRTAQSGRCRRRRLRVEWSRSWRKLPCFDYLPLALSQAPTLLSPIALFKLATALSRSPSGARQKRSSISFVIAVVSCAT